MGGAFVRRGENCSAGCLVIGVKESLDCQWNFRLGVISGLLFVPAKWKTALLLEIRSVIFFAQSKFQSRTPNPRKNKWLMLLCFYIQIVFTQSWTVKTRKPTTFLVSGYTAHNVDTALSLHDLLGQPCKWLRFLSSIVLERKKENSQKIANWPLKSYFHAISFVMATKKGRTNNFWREGRQLTCFSYSLQILAKTSDWNSEMKPL